MSVAGRGSAARGRRTREILGAERVVEREHRHAMRHFGEAAGRRAADRAGSANRAGPGRETRLDRRVAPAQRVVFGVGDLRRVVRRDRRGRRRDLGASRASSAAASALRSARRALVWAPGEGAAPDPAMGRPPPQFSSAEMPCFGLAWLTAAPNRLSAAARAASVTVSPASMRAISSRRAAAVERFDAGFGAAAPAISLATRRCAAPRAATCGLWVTSSTCTRSRHPRQPLAHRGGGGAADAGIDLVEHQRRHRRAAGQHHLQRQHQPRQFAARGDPRQRPGLLAGIGGDQEAHRVGAARPPGGLRQWRDVGDEAGAVQPQRRQFPGDRPVQLARRLARAPPTARRRPRRRRPAPPPPPPAALPTRPRRFPAPPAGRAACPAGPGSSATATLVLAGGGAQGEQPLLGLLQRARVGLGRLGQPGEQRFRLGQRFLGPFQRGQRRRRPGCAVRGRGSRCSARAAARSAAAGPGLRRSRGASSARAAAIASARLLALLQRAAARPPARSSSPASGRRGRSSSTAWRSQSSSRCAASDGFPAPRPGAPTASRQARQRGATASRSGGGTPKASSSAAWPDGIGEAHLVVLALHLHQQRADAAQQRRAHRLVVDEGAASGRRAPARGAARSRPRRRCPARPAARRPGGPGGGANTAATLACSAPARTSPASARAPRARPRLSSRIDLPAPVSPVSTVRPAPKQIQPLDQHHIADRERGEHAAPAGHGAAQKSEPKVRLKKPGLRRPAVPGSPVAFAARRHQWLVAVLVPFAARVVVAEHRGGLARLVGQAEHQVDLGQPVQRLGHVVGGLVVVHHALEPADRGGVQVLLLVEAADLHLLAGEVVAGEVDLQPRVAAHRRCRGSG